MPFGFQPLTAPLHALAATLLALPAQLLAFAANFLPLAADFFAFPGSLQRLTFLRERDARTE